MNLNNQITMALAEREKLNKSLENNQNTKEISESVGVSNLSLGLNLKPSEYLPIRTARFWSEVVGGNDLDFNFYKVSKTGIPEIHRNATKGFSKYVDLIGFEEVRKETEFELSLKGESDIAVFKQENQIVPLKIALVRKQYFPDKSLRFYQGIVNFDTGTMPLILTKKFYYNKSMEVIMENIPYERTIDDEGNSVWRDISLKNFEKKTGATLASKINLGKIPFPVVTLTNMGADRNGTGLSDTAEVQDILTRLDVIVDAKDRAIKTAKTRLFNKRVNGTMDLGGDTQTLSPMAKQILEDAEVVDYHVDPSNEDSNGTLIVDRALNADVWQSIETNELQKYYSYTGENVAADAHGNNQHTFEVQSKGDNKFRRGTSKKKQRVKEYKALFDIIIAIAKSMNINDFAGVDEISIHIHEVDIRKEFELEDKVEKLMSLGLMSKVQALMKLEGIDELTAKIRLTAMEEHNKMFKDEDKENEDKITVNDGSDNNTDEPVQVEQEEK